MSEGSPERLSLERPISAAGQLLVEGRVPQMFFRELVIISGLASAIDVRTFGDIAKTNLQTFLELFTQKAEFKERVQRLGIVRDAETSNAPSAFQSVQAALRDARLPDPSQMQKFGGNPLAVGIFILPTCQDPGMLESLCLEAVAEDEKAHPVGVLPCVDEFFACLAKRGRQPSNPTKARFAGYALAHDVIDPQLGRAAQKGTIPWEAKVFDPLKTFLKNLAGI